MQLDRWGANTRLGKSQRPTPVSLHVIQTDQVHWNVLKYISNNNLFLWTVWHFASMQFVQKKEYLI